MNVHEAWNLVMQDVTAIRKAERNKAQGFTFRGIDAVVNSVGPALRERQVSVVPISVEAKHRDFQSKNGTLQHEAIVTVGWRVTGPEGDSFEGMSIGESADSSDKATTQAMSVAFRVFLLQALCVPTDEPDPDLNTVDRAPDPVHEPTIGKADVDRITELLKNAPEPEAVKATWKARFGVWPSALPVSRLDEANDWLSDLTTEANR